MAKYKYTLQKFDKEKMVKIVGTKLSISTKASGEIARFIKKKQIDRAIEYLEDVIKIKKAIPYKKYTEVGHRKGEMAAGRYPKKAARYVIKLLKGLKKEAETKGLDENKLVIIHTVAQKGTRTPRYGRQRGRTRKNTHFEVIGEERDIKVKKKAQERSSGSRSKAATENKKQEKKKSEPAKPEKSKVAKPKEIPKKVPEPSTGGTAK